MLGGVSGWLGCPRAQLTASAEGRAGGWWLAGRSSQEGRAQSYALRLARVMGSTRGLLMSLGLPFHQMGSVPCLPPTPTQHTTPLPFPNQQEGLRSLRRDTKISFRISSPFYHSFLPPTLERAFRCQYRNCTVGPGSHSPGSHSLDRWPFPSPKHACP